MMLSSLRKILYRSGMLFAAIALLIAGFNAPSAKAQSAESLSGWFTILWGDGVDGVTSFQEYHIQTDDGKSVRVLMDESVAQPWGGILALNGSKVTVQGAWNLNAAAAGSQSTFQVTSLNVEQTDLNAAAVVSGAQPFISILCVFSGEAAPAAPYDSPAYFQNMYGSAYPGLDHYWRESSYNMINVVGSGSASAWVQLPKVFSQYVSDTSVPPDGNPDEFNSDLLFTDCTAAADPIVNYSGYVGINMMFNRNELTGYALGGGKNATLDGVTKTWRVTWEPGWGYKNITVISHEMGHSFGLPHSSGNYGVTYDNQWDVMSDTWTNCNNSKDLTYGCLGQHTNSYYKDKLGWIPSSQKFTSTYVGGTTTVTLERLAQPTSSSNYLMAKIPIGGSATHFYAVEARKKIGYDVQLPGEAVIIHDVDTTRGRPAYVIDPDNNGNTGDAGAMWTVGETFTDAPNGISVAVLSDTGTGYQVSITSPAYTLTYCATSATPEAYISRIQLNSGDQASGAGAGGYEDRTASSFTTLTQGTSYPFQLTGVWPYSNAQLHAAKVWVDFNKNGDFTDSGEELDLGSASMTGTRVFSGNLSVPGGALIGTTRMRAMFKYTDNGFSAPSPCDTGAWGEAEDYTVAIQAGISAPEMNVKGNSVSIVDGDTTPSSADHTEFGSVGVTGGTVERVFTVENTGNANLTLSGSPLVSISGANAADFTVTAVPTSPVSAGGSTTFTVRFDPSAAGARTASISIANNDADENPYNFDILGTGSAVAIPEMDVKGNGVSITDGDTTPSSADNTEFGSVSVTGGTVDRVFTVENTGNANLTLSGSPLVSISGANAADFTVTVIPTSPVSAGGSTTFTVRFDPSAAGARTASISIANDDTDENPYNFDILGTGSAAIASERVVNGGFEKYTGISKIPQSWKAAKFTISDGKTTTHKSGKFGLVVAGNGVKKTLTQSWTTADGAAGDTFNLSFWAKGISLPKAGTCQIDVSFFNGSTATGDKITLKCPAGGYNWKKLTAPIFATTAAYTRVEIKITVMKTSGAILFDGVSLFR
jgi:M6 family metalloprotease-like protein